MSKEVSLIISDLERELALKRAYANLSISFPKSLKLPDDVQEEVIAKMTQFALRLAQGEVKTEVDTFSSEDLDILRALIESVKAKSKSPKATQKEVKKVETTKPQQKQAVKSAFLGKATILTTDSIERSARKFVDNGMTVFIESTSGDKATVKSRAGFQFSINLEDLEIIEDNQ